MSTKHLMCPPPIAASVPASLISPAPQGGPHGHRAPAPSPHAARRVRREYVDDLPELYAMRTEGDCMEPLCHHGDKLVFSTTAALKVGDMAVIWRSPTATPAREFQAIIKRLITLPPRFVKLPHVGYPESDIWPFVIAEYLNPPTKIIVYCSDVFAIHACVGRLDLAGRMAAVAGNTSGVRQ